MSELDAQDQTHVLELLTSASTHHGAPVERIDTHTAVVFLAGANAYKLKRAVRYDYLDFSTPERRRACCEAEVRLNRRTAPDLYRGVVPVTRELDGSLALGGSGTPVDWLIVMRRFDQGQLLDRLALQGQLDLNVMTPLAAEIAALHRGAERRADHGGAAGMRWVVEGNREGLAEFGAEALEPAARRQLIDESNLLLQRWSGLLDARRDAGYVRQGHGDLHLRNIVLLDGRPVLFDGVEFNDEIACTDVLYDLAFLLMDLWRRRLPAHANRVFNEYLAETDDMGGFALMPLFLACRAAVRTKTSLTAARVAAGGRRPDLESMAREYLAMALRFLRPPPPVLMAMGGFSGSGKSTLARLLAPAMGAAPGSVILPSDVIRKRLCGVAATQPLGPDGYSSDVSRRVYEIIGAQARQIVGNGHSVIADAAYLDAGDRATVERIASDAGVRFVGCWLDAPESTLVARVSARVNDPSDADAGVIRSQRARPTGPIDWHRVDASRPLSAVADTLSGLLGASATWTERGSWPVS